MNPRFAEETAFAKINLALHVRERLPDGYHRIETWFAFAEEGDRLSVSISDRLELEVTGPFANSLPTSIDNLVLLAAERLRREARLATGAKLRLEKRLPVAAGLGGGSADAAAALRLLSRWWEIDMGEERLLALAAELGADVPACLESRTVRGEGRGDRLTSRHSPSVTGSPVLLVNPRVELSTAKVFAAWEGVDDGPLEGWEEGRNGLQTAASRLCPEIPSALALLEGARTIRMSGSGATCYGLFDDLATRDRAAARIGRVRPDWWLMASRLR